MSRGIPGRVAATCHPDREHDGHGLCRSCNRKRRYWLHPEPKRAAARESARKSKYGLDQAAFDAWVECVGGLCAICGLPERGKALAIDHDHDTGAIRGLLCQRCNRGIGMFGDDTDRLAAAIRYLEVHGR